MKFMLMMNAPKGDGNWGVTNWAPQDFKAMVDFMKNFSKRLKENGELVGAEGLAAPAQAKLVRAGKNGTPEVTWALIPGEEAKAVMGELYGPFTRQGVPRGLWDRRRRNAGTRVCDRRRGVGRAWAGW